jgi:hypothetical protein
LIERLDQARGEKLNVVPSDRMPEAEVSLRLAFFLINHGLASADVSVAIDGAQVQTGDAVHFSICEFLREHGWTCKSTSGGWYGLYRCEENEHGILIHPRPGKGDVVAPLGHGGTLRAECKKGRFQRSKSSQEYPLLREALGQLLTAEAVNPNDILAVAVPKSPRVEELARKWRFAPLIQRAGIRILTVDREGNVEGLDLPA